MFRNLIAANFAENPDLILDLLRNQSEAVLTIAQAGAGKKEPETAPDKKTGTAPESAANISEAEFKKLLVKTLNDDPNLILDVLRAHPEEVLAIAQQGNQERRKKALLRQWEQDAKTPKPFATRNRPMRGAPNAPVLIAAYSDFCCPHCAKASQVIEEYLLSNPTKVHFIFKHRPLASHQHSRIAAQYFIAASMQNDLKAWALYKGMYNGRSELMTRGEAFITELAGKIGLNMERLKADAHGEEALRILEEDIRESKEFGFDGAPYILINNLVLAGAPSPEILDFGVREAMRLK
ncbi:MAG: thioredoxin domain-containing protein [Desulfovibrionaceae bacterium]|nr:thioredoxin domain-containing protein [Desulfovibrionaceae bacterium]